MVSPPLPSSPSARRHAIIDSVEPYPPVPGPDPAAPPVPAGRAASSDPTGAEADAAGTVATEIPPVDSPDPDDPDLAPPSGAANWQWVRELRASDEPVPWAPGVTLALFVALVTGSAIYVLSDGLTGQPLLAVLANAVIGIGLAPAVWLSRSLRLLRWLALGVAVGVIAGWVAALVFLS